jgi:hypothetical protein
MVNESGNAAYTNVVQRLEKEKELVGRLTELLRKELEIITNQDAEALEDSMPEKIQLLRTIKENRQGVDSIERESLFPYETRIQGLKQDLVVLWKKASGLNELSKSMVTGRLAEIERQLEPFFAGTKGGYTRDGKRSKGLYRTVNTGV